ncbi:DNA-primase RepB domain-containing protein [Sulfobacillus harzensis]|uniref:RepB-like DNA primase domain-containing protein n=1 Tax=Sulfobacillus harzensis TaxID=2729629 RepID=A0A7Y0Q484_9FIRM|nr:DNA-primase RepB domain-containing protein [Sulfobacillus harzensis]NMP23731.1 hypothetical protein [Sulfobacillus harzensis]
MGNTDATQAQQMLGALGEDLSWRLIKADEQHHLKGEAGHWMENPRAPGQRATDLPLDRLDDQFAWHVRPMPKDGPYRLTMLDDATQETVERMTAEGLPPTAVVETSPGRFQVWHRWPWRMDRDHTVRLLKHLQSHFDTDPGANAPGHVGRLAGTRNWKRQPEKGIDRAGAPVSLVITSQAITRDQASAWLSRFPVPRPEQHPKSITIPSGRVGDFDFTDLRYQRMLARSVPLLPQVWSQTYAQTGDASRADMVVAIRAVSLQLDDATIEGILDPLVHQDGRKEHRTDYTENTVAKARAFSGVSSPGVWSMPFDAARQFPWLADRDHETRRPQAANGWGDGVQQRAQQQHAAPPAAEEEEAEAEDEDEYEAE